MRHSRRHRHLNKRKRRTFKSIARFVVLIFGIVILVWTFVSVYYTPPRKTTFRTFFETFSAHVEQCPHHTQRNRTKYRIIKTYNRSVPTRTYRESSRSMARLVLRGNETIRKSVSIFERKWLRGRCVYR